MNVKIRLYGEVRKFYPYRSAILVGLNLVIEDEEGNLAKVVEKYLKPQGYRMDNHICWETTTGVCFEYSDHKLYIGSSIKEGRW